MKSAKVLIYNIKDKNKLDGLINIFESEGISYKMIDEDSAFQRIGYLVGLDGYRKIEDEKIKSKPAKNELLFFAFLDEENMVNVLKKMKENNILVKLKAGLTDTNSNWILNDLILHVEEESAMMDAYTTLLRDVNGIDNIVEKKSSTLINLLNEAKMLGKNKDLQVKEIEEHHIKVLDEFRNHVDNEMQLSNIQDLIFKENQKMKFAKLQ